jgi:hypothetical protein
MVDTRTRPIIRGPIIWSVGRTKHEPNEVEGNEMMRGC